MAQQSELKLNENGIPNFDDLPLRKGDPMLSAWGLYGDNDELGTLNRLTDERVAAAAREEIRTGARVSLNWALNAQSPGAFFNRRIFHHDVFAKPPRTVNDDIWTFNSQGSSQWDGVRHFGYQKEKLFYNGVAMSDIHPNGARSTVNGIQAWSQTGIIGRAILLDLPRWRTSQNLPPYQPFTTTPIPLADLLSCLRHQNHTTPQFGDILLIRSGFMAAHAAKTPAELATLQATFPHEFIGVEQSEEMLRWIWENFSAVAGDQPSFEAWPTQKEWHLHEVLLAGWGCPIGELFDLERLAEKCEELGRWSFFVTSEPCNVDGGVASPPNIMAIF
ncbi:hypothetical protein B0T16DRAFT_454228 [Cercophora newfieldiana]|uniref:Cyclase n=1 Tax=Cercophora newfieldiana TaxID=92897 RepID=A0AA39YFR0_9PEZI|nr:hypothetical protein B0T16DRAFT_454228 [Cercophora newfieldiana]